MSTEPRADGDAVAYFVILLSWLVVFIGGVVVGRT